MMSEDEIKSKIAELQSLDFMQKCMIISRYAYGHGLFLQRNNNNQNNMMPNVEAINSRYCVVEYMLVENKNRNRTEEEIEMCIRTYKFLFFLLFGSSFSSKLTIDNFIIRYKVV